MSIRVTPASRAACTIASASAGEGRCSFVDRGMAPSPMALTVTSPMLRCCTDLSCPAGSVRNREFAVRRARASAAATRSTRRAARRPDAAARARRGRRPAAPARRPRPAAPAGGVRRADVAGPLRPARHRQDHARARHLAGHQAAVRRSCPPWTPASRRCARSSHDAKRELDLRRPPHGAVHRRGAPLLQDPAGQPAVRGRGPDRQPDRRDHREPVLLRGQPAAVAQPACSPCSR